MSTNNATCDLVVGGDSSIGRQLHRRLVARGESVLVTSRRMASAGGDVLPLDLARPSLDVLNALERPIGVAWLCAAIGSLEACHRDPAAARQVNVEGSLLLAEHLLSLGAFVVFLSTNLVFDGERAFVSADGRRFPQTEYGRHKALVEQFLESRREQAAIVRLTKVVAPGERRFWQWRETLASGGEVCAFGDLPFSPLSLDLAVEGLLNIADLRQGGLWQLGGAEDMTYREAALGIAKLVGADASQVTDASASALDYYDRLPRHATLDSSRASDAFQFAPPPAWPTILSAMSAEHEGRG